MEINLHVAVIQADLLWEDPMANRSMFDVYFDEVKTAHLVVLPEMFTTGFTMNAQNLAEPMDGPTITWMKEQSEKHGFAIMGSIVISENGRFFNRLVMTTSDGLVQCYDKRHLFSMGNEHLTYSPGSNLSVFSLMGLKIKPAICYDLRFPVWLRNSEHYDVLVCVANWPAARSEVFNTLLKARAIENQCYVIGVNRVGTDKMNLHYNGYSQIIDARGTVISAIQPDTSGIFVAELSMTELYEFRRKFPVLEEADAFELKKD